jgi:hypothetical protein
MAKRYCHFYSIRRLGLYRYCRRRRKVEAMIGRKAGSRSHIELRDIRAFLAVADALGFRSAADRNDIAQSALSRRVRLLEDDIGVSLFESHVSRATTPLSNAYAAA